MTLSEFLWLMLSHRQSRGDAKQSPTSLSLLLLEKGEVYCCIKRRLSPEQHRMDARDLLALKMFEISTRRRSEDDKQNRIRRTGQFYTLCERRGFQR